MFPGKKIHTVTMTLALVMAILIAGLGAADTTYAAPPTQEAVPQSTGIPYAGQLNNAAGQPVADGIYDFTFSLYDAPTGGDLLWTGTQAGVTVQGGSFSASLGSDTGLPKAVLDLKECWLAVSVRGPDESGFTALEPRQLLPTDGPAAVSALSCPHSHFTDSWSGSNSAWGLHLSNTGTGDGLRAYSKATLWNYAAVFGANTATTGSGTGVYGYSEKGLGMRAESNGSDGLEAVTSVSNKSAVYAHSANGNGVWAVSGSAIGVRGGSNTGRGVEGSSNTTYAGYFRTANYRGGYMGTANTSSWYGAWIQGGVLVTDGGCVGCAVLYMGRNDGDIPIRSGDFVAVSGAEVAEATGQPVLLVRTATRPADVVIGVAVDAVADPRDLSMDDGSKPDKSTRAESTHGQYMTIMVSGLAQVRVGAAEVAVGDRLAPSPDGAIAATDATSSVARVLSAPDASGLAWAMVSAR